MQARFRHLAIAIVSLATFACSSSNGSNGNSGGSGSSGGGSDSTCPGAKPLTSACQDYENCGATACMSETQACNSQCQAWNSCAQGCGKCNVACIEKCTQSQDCLTCLQPATSCITQACQSKLNACTDSMLAGIEGGAVHTCADLRQCCATASSAYQPTCDAILEAGVMLDVECNAAYASLHCS